VGEAIACPEDNAIYEESNPVPPVSETVRTSPEKEMPEQNSPVSLL
jgi:hypothetical protein